MTQSVFVLHVKFIKNVCIFYNNHHVVRLWWCGGDRARYQQKFSLLIVYRYVRS